MQRDETEVTTPCTSVYLHNTNTSKQTSPLMYASKILHKSLSFNKNMKIKICTCICCCFLLSLLWATTIVFVAVIIIIAINYSNISNNKHNMSWQTTFPLHHTTFCVYMCVCALTLPIVLGVKLLAF